MSYKETDAYTRKELLIMAQNIREYVMNGKEEFYTDFSYRKKGTYGIKVKGITGDVGKRLIEEARKLDDLAELKKKK